MNSQHELSRFGLLAKYLRGSYGLLAFTALCSVFNVFFNFLTPQVVRITVDSVIDDEPFNLPAVVVGWLQQLGGRDYLRSNLIICAAVAVVIAVLSGIFNYLCRVNMTRTSESTLERLRNGLYGHIQKLPYSWHIRVQTGDIIQRCTSDVEILRNFMSSQLLELFRTLMLVTVALGWMFSMSVSLSIVSVCFIPIVILYSSVFYGKISKRFRAADEAEGALSTAVQENLTGVRVVRAFGREAHEIENFDKRNNLYANLWIKLGTLMGSYWGLGDFATALQVLTIVILGTIMAVNGELTLGEFTVFVSYNSMMAWPVRNFGRILGDMSKMSVSLDRLREILNEPEEKDDPDGLTPDMTGDIVFDDVCFGYKDGPQLLHNVSFTADSGTTIGILGATGSGKSTLTYLLTRLYDLGEDGGRITVGGVNINDIKLSHLRGNIGLVLQEPFLFSRSIAKNICATRPEASPEEMRAAAASAAVDEAIMDFHDQYDTIIGERGVTLSGGQKQRVAIARMLMQKTPIKIFDDSLSAVDAETDAKIRAALRTESAGSTVFIISHRINTIMHANRIIVMDEGRIAESGTHDELLALGGIYKRIFDIQSSLGEELEGGEK